MAFDPGRVRVSLLIEGGVVGDAGVVCTRPEVAHLLRGQPADKATALVPLIYSLCGKAQGIAARAALVAARGVTVAPHIDAEALAEAAREHAWKLFVDWPKQLGFAPDEAYFVRLMRSLPGQRAELATELSGHALVGRLRAAIGGGNSAGLLAKRLTERFQELRGWLVDAPGCLGRVSAASVAPQTGEARVETARGTLVHRLTLDGEKVADYTITAPTDVHFAAGGDAARGLAGLKGSPRAEAEREALLLVLAFDPCVPWELEVA
jgi:hypothetical protein